MLDVIKRYLNITWDDPDTDKDLEEIIEEGKAYLQGKSGTKLNFEEDYVSRRLLKDYCRYAYNHSFELFEVNFKRELLFLALQEGVKARADKKKN